MAYTKSVFILVALFCISGTAFSQTVIINGKKIETSGGSVTIKNGEVIIDGKSQAAVKGSGKLDKEDRKLADFHQLVVSTSADVTIKAGKSIRCTVIADDNLIPLIKTEVAKKRLTITTKGAIKSKSRIKVDLELPLLTSIAMQGSGKATLADVTKKELKVSILGSGDVVAMGKVAELNATIQGSGSVDARFLQAAKATATIQGSGDAMIHAKQLVATIQGSGDILHNTPPSNVRSTVQGSGDISQKTWPPRPKIKRQQQSVKSK